MAEIKNDSPAANIIDDAGEWEQATLRKLGNGDYVRVLALKYGNSARIQFGRVEETGTNLVVWRWEIIAGHGDVAGMLYDLSYAAQGMARTIDAYIAAAAQKTADLEMKVVNQARELKELKDGKVASADATVAPSDRGG